MNLPLSQKCNKENDCTADQHNTIITIKYNDEADDHKVREGVFQDPGQARELCSRAGDREGSGSFCQRGSSTFLI